MRTRSSRWKSVLESLLPLALILAAPPATGRTLDDFNDNAKTDWKDFTFVPGFGLPSETDGRFVFQQPPAGRAIFSASQKISEEIELRSGRTVEIRADVIEAGDKDSFAVLAFIPTGNSPGTLEGYGLAKSKTDILLTKGINKYFIAENPDTPIKNENITLSLTMTGVGTSVHLTVRVLDKDDGNKVIYEKTVIDTPNADVLADGTDDPAGAFLTKGYFTLYLYQDFDKNAPENPYRIVYDNASVDIVDLTVLDAFAGPKTDWKDFTFVAGFGIPTIEDGRFVFSQPPAGRAIFSASQKISREIELKNGESTELRVDLIEAGDKDSFAVLAFIPTGNSPGTLEGYGLAKSKTDILLTKGINKYFIAENPDTPIKNENVTLSLKLTGVGDAVQITVRVLDKDDGNKVIYEKTVTDTAAADVLVDGTDSPAGAFLTKGYFTLYLYQDFDKNAPENPYRVIYDNAILIAPPEAANLPPTISAIAPVEFSNFIPETTEISFTVSDDADLSDDRIGVTLNGTLFTKASGLALSGTGRTRTAKLGGLKANRNYLAVLRAEDAGGLVVSESLFFDTFGGSVPVIEVEDYNFDGGSFINQPVPLAEGSGPQADSYSQQVGVAEADFHDSRTSPRSQDAPWRSQDPVRMQRTLDLERSKYASAGGSAAEIYDYDVGDIAAGDWMQYTRDFPDGTYEVYLREALANMSSGESVLERVDGNVVQTLGSFLGARTGFKYRNFPLTDGAGISKIPVRLKGRTTLRLRHLTPDPGDGGRYLNYLVFVPIEGPVVQRASVVSITPTPGSTVESVALVTEIVVQDQETRIDTSSVKLQFNGSPALPIVFPAPGGASIQHIVLPLPPAGSTNRYRLEFADNEGIVQTLEWFFVLTYRTLPASARVDATGTTRGINVRVAQAAAPGENSLAWAEDLLNPKTALEKHYDIREPAEVINFSQNGAQGSADGYFPDDLPIPGQSEDFGSDNFAMEATGYIELPQGTTRFGFRCDDGYQLAISANPTAATLPFAFHNGGPADEVISVVAEAAGLYPFRFVWYERGGGAHVEWFVFNPSGNQRNLVNGEGGPRVFREIKVNAPAAQLLTAARVDGPYAAAAGAVLAPAPAKRFTVPADGATRFYRIRSGSATRIRSIQLGADGTTVTIDFE